MKRNLITLVGVVAIVAGIVAVRSTFDQTIQSENAAVQAAEEQLAEAKKITEEAKAAAATLAAGESVDAPVASVPLEGFEEIPWVDATPEVFQVKFDTTAGSFVVESNRAWSALGSDRFYELCRTGFFEDSGFFRVVPGFVVQFGLAANPRETAQYSNKNLKDESALMSNTKGMLSFAAGGPNTRTTQIFINYGDNANLDGMGFAPFGRVIAGMENAEKINAEYGEQPDQFSIRQEGTEYLRREFPNLDFITKVTLVKRTVAPAPAAEPAPTPAAEAAPTPGE